MTELCNDQDSCNRPLNHEGIHGYEAMPGVILAPRSNHGKEYRRDPCDLICLHCDGPMEIGQAEYGGNVYCLNCDEVYSFDEHGFASKYATIFPSSDPHKYKPEVKEEFITHWRKQNSLRNEGEHLFGMKTATERDTGRKSIEKSITDWWDKDGRLNRPFWQFWKKA